MTDFDAVRDEADAMAERIDALVAVPPSEPELQQLECPECASGGQHRLFNGANGLGVHRRATHGVRGPTSKTPKRRGRPPGSRNQPKPPRPVQVTPDWDVDDIFTPVMRQMFPSGEIPIHAVLALVRWRADTQRMLNEVADDSR